MPKQRVGICFAHSNLRVLVTLLGRHVDGDKLPRAPPGRKQWRKERKAAGQVEANLIRPELLEDPLRNLPARLQSPKGLDGSGRQIREHLMPRSSTENFLTPKASPLYQAHDRRPVVVSAEH